MAGIVDRAVLSYSQMPDSAKIAMLSEAISQLQSEMAVANSRIEEIDGDFPQQILMGGDSGGGLEIAGTPELFKVCALTGWTLDSEGEWTQMSISEMVASPPTTLWSGQTEAGNYLRPTWDWVRAYEDA